jgi:hypothetical protein
MSAPPPPAGDADAFQPHSGQTAVNNAKLTQLLGFESGALAAHKAQGGVCPFMQLQSGMAYMDDDNSLKAGARGPSLLEDQIHREKINHFDHERIPERVVHARGTGAHGQWEAQEGAWEAAGEGARCDKAARRSLPCRPPTSLSLTVRRCVCPACAFQATSR